MDSAALARALGEPALVDPGAGQAPAEQVPGSIALGPVWGCNLSFAEGNLLAELREQKIALTKQKKLLTHRLKNEQRKRQRLREKAKKLSNEDLLFVVAERQSLALAKAKAKARA